MGMNEEEERRWLSFNWELHLKKGTKEGKVRECLLLFGHFFLFCFSECVCLNLVAGDGFRCLTVM